MDPAVVLVLGSARSSRLSRQLAELGLRPLTQFTMRDALDRLRHGRFTAVLVDREHASADVLEFVLNVRDLDPHTPIVIVGHSTQPAEDELLTSQVRTYVLDSKSAQIAGALRDVPSWEKLSGG